MSSQYTQDIEANAKNAELTLLLGDTGRSVMIDTESILFIIITPPFGECLTDNKYSDNCMLLSERQSIVQEKMYVQTIVISALLTKCHETTNELFLLDEIYKDSRNVMKLVQPRKTKNSKDMEAMGW